MSWRRGAGGGDGAVARRWVLLLCAGSFSLGLLFTSGYVCMSPRLQSSCSISRSEFSTPASRFRASLRFRGILRGVGLGRVSGARSAVLLLAFGGQI